MQFCHGGSLRSVGENARKLSVSLACADLQGKAYVDGQIATWETNQTLT